MFYIYIYVCVCACVCVCAYMYVYSMWTVTINCQAMAFMPHASSSARGREVLSPDTTEAPSQASYHEQSV